MKNIEMRIRKIEEKLNIHGASIEDCPPQQPGESNADFISRSIIWVLQFVTLEELVHGANVDDETQLD